jgi:RimJ/RimL family protein N-acetyltransferase
VFHRSERLLLRPIWPEDWQNLLAGIGDEGVVRNLSSAPWPYLPEDARAFSQRSVDPLFPRCLITRAADAAVIGCIGIDPVDDGAAVELGYWIARNHWGQGYATEAGAVMIGFARMLGHPMLSAAHFADNPASGRVLRKLGFEPTGRVVMRYSKARGAKAKTHEYRLALDDQAGGHLIAA